MPFQLTFYETPDRPVALPEGRLDDEFVEAALFAIDELDGKLEQAMEQLETAAE